MRGSRPRKLRKASSRPGAADGQQRGAEVVAVRALEAAVLLEPLDALGVQHLAPDVGVVAGAVAAAAKMCAK